MAYPGIAFAVFVGAGLGLALWYLFSDPPEAPHGPGSSPSRNSSPPTNTWTSSQPSNNRARHRNVRSGKEENTECTICCEPMNSDVVKLQCGHRFHTSCIGKWKQVAQNAFGCTCPNCRQKI